MQVVRFEPEVVFPLALQVDAQLVFAAGLGFSFWAVQCNPYFEPLYASRVTAGRC
jgi:hypothetical protein